MSVSGGVIDVDRPSDTDATRALGDEPPPTASALSPLSPTGIPEAVVSREDDVDNDAEQSDDGDDEDDGSSATSSTASTSSARSGQEGASAAPGPCPVIIDRLKLIDSNAQIGNITNVHSPTTVLNVKSANLVTSSALWTPASAISPTTASGAAPPSNGSQAVFILPGHTNNSTGSAAEAARPGGDPNFRPRDIVLLTALAVTLVVGMVVVVMVYLPTHGPADPIINLPNGVRLAKRSFWHARPPGKVPKKLFTPVQLIIINHSAGAFCFDSNKCKEVVYNIQAYHMDIDDHQWDDIGYNFMIGGDGVTYEGRGWDAVGSHDRGWNNRSLGVGILGDFSEKTVSDAQRTQLDAFIAWGVELGKVRRGDYLVVGACQLHKTASPGHRFMEELRTWTRWWNYSTPDHEC